MATIRESTCTCISTSGAQEVTACCTVHLPNFVSPYLTRQPCMCVYSHSSKVMLFSTGGGFSKTHRFGFTAHSGSSCDSVSLPRSAVHDPFTDTVFSVAIVHQDQPPFDLGPHSSASLIISALKGIYTRHIELSYKHGLWLRIILYIHSLCCSTTGLPRDVQFDWYKCSACSRE